jgi:RNA polymerase sigma-32 factor
MAAASSISRHNSQTGSWIEKRKDLAAEEERELMRRWHDEGDMAAREALVVAFMPRVKAIAGMYRSYPVDQEDLVSEGAVGLLVGIDRFEPKRNVRLMTYASHWIRAYIVNAIIKAWGRGKTGMGITRSRMFFRVRRERARYAARHDDADVAVARMAADVGISEKRMREMLHALDSPDFSLDAYAEASGQPDLRDRIKDRSPGPDEDAFRTEFGALLGDAVTRAMGSLNGRERMIAERRLMNDDPATLADIGREIGVSRERARQIELRAKRKIGGVFASAGLA